MIHLIKKHKRKIIIGHIAAATLLVSDTITPGMDSVLYFAPYDDSANIVVGETIDIDINLNSNDPVNAVSATVTFPPDKFEVVGFDKKQSFLELWTEETSIKETAGEVHWSGGTTAMGGHIGVGNMLTISLRAKAPGEASLAFKDSEIYLSDGEGTAAKSDSRILTYTIDPAGDGLKTAVEVETAPPPASPDLNEDGKVTITDLSIMTIKIVGEYNQRYDFNRDGHANLTDLSILMSSMYR